MEESTAKGEAPDAAEGKGVASADAAEGSGASNNAESDANTEAAADNATEVDEAAAAGVYVCVCARLCVRGYVNVAP